MVPGSLTSEAILAKKSVVAESKPLGASRWAISFAAFQFDLFVDPPVWTGFCTRGTRKFPGRDSTLELQTKLAAVLGRNRVASIGSDSR